MPRPVKGISGAPPNRGISLNRPPGLPAATKLVLGTSAAARRIAGADLAQFGGTDIPPTEAA